MRGKRIKQINNLTITYTDDFQYSIWTKDGRCLEDRMTFEQAEEYCRNTKDFVKYNHTVYWEILLSKKERNFIDSLVDGVNCSKCPIQDGCKAKTNEDCLLKIANWIKIKVRG